MARAARQTLGAGSACLFGLQILLSRGPTCRHSCSEADAHTRALSLPCFRGHDCEFESWTEWSAYLSPEKNQTMSLNMLQCLPGRVSMGTTRGFEPERPWPRFAVSGKRIKEIARLLFLLPVAELLATGFELSQLANRADLSTCNSPAAATHMRRPLHETETGHEEKVLD